MFGREKTRHTTKVIQVSAFGTFGCTVMFKVPGVRIGVFSAPPPPPAFPIHRQEAHD